ncbi:hypothetical protein J6590_057539 [Homalodisca vitripennis]|nr:hypothetical protein J6590_057539 [Homalodisca vitripennis]
MMSDARDWKLPKKEDLRRITYHYKGLGIYVSNFEMGIEAGRDNVGSRFYMVLKPSPRRKPLSGIPLRRYNLSKCNIHCEAQSAHITN